MEKLDQIVKDFNCTKYNKGMGKTRKVSRMTREETKTNIIAIEKHYRSEGSNRSLESYVGRKNKEILTKADLQNNVTTSSITIKERRTVPKDRPCILLNWSYKVGKARPHKGVKASANSDVMYFFTSAQDGDPSQDDVRLCLNDDLKKAQDHSQRQA
ncbi:hypothetical protein Tco_1195587 [Tanacetum coccineum]